MSMINQIDFTTDIRPLYDANGKIVPSEMGRGVYREDTDELIAFAGPNFKAVDHMEVVSPVLDHLSDLGYDIIDRPERTASFYDLIGQKGAFLTTDVAKNGAVMRADIVLGDFVEVTGSSAYLPSGPDTMLHRISLLNSHDGSLAVHANTSWLRLICANSMVDARWSVNTRAKHTSGLDIEALKARVANGASAISGDAEVFEKYARTKVTIKQAELFIQQTLAKLANKPNGDAHFSEPLTMQVLDLFHREDQTVFGLWNSLTAWATHGKHKANAVGLTTTLGRESRVASAMRAPQWKQLLAA